MIGLDNLFLQILIAFIILFYGRALVHAVGRWSSPAPKRTPRNRSTRTSRRRTNASTGKSGSKRSRATDPKDTTTYLKSRGWTQVSSLPERYVGRYVGNGKSMDGGLERTPAGRRKFLVNDPPPSFKQQAHGGGCLQERQDLGDDTYEVHFNKRPASFGDGIDVITNMLRGNDD